MSTIEKWVSQVNPQGKDTSTGDKSDPWYHLQHGIDAIVALGGPGDMRILHVMNIKDKENVVMNGAQYHDLTIIGELSGAPTETIGDPQFCDLRPAIVANDKTKPVFSIGGGAKNICLQNLGISAGCNGVAAIKVDPIKLIHCCIHHNSNDNSGGGGFYFQQCDKPLIQQCRIFNNKVTGNTGFGGGGSLFNCKDAKITGSLFYKNQAEKAGGAIRMDQGKAKIDGNTFGGPLGANSAENGGAISIDTHADVEVGISQKNEFISNTAANFGGAFSLELSKCKIGNDSFTDNSADKKGGAIYLNNFITASLSGADIDKNNVKTGGQGGGIFAEATLVAATLNLESCKLHGNTAKDGKGGALAIEFRVTATITKSHFFETNESELGGGLYFASTQGATLTVKQTDFDDNSADRGGGCYAQDGPVKIERCNLKNNNGSTAGGGIYFNGHNAAGSKIEITHCQFDKNGTGLSGGAAFVSETIAGSIRHNELTDNSGGFYLKSDNVKSLNCEVNECTNNKTTAGVEDIVTESDASHMTKAQLTAANTVGKVIPVVIVK